MSLVECRLDSMGELLDLLDRLAARHEVRAAAGASSLNGRCPLPSRSPWGST